MTARTRTVREHLFHRQGIHAGALALLLAVVWATARHPAVSEGGLWGLSSASWLWLVVAAAVCHQVYVWLVWRLELHGGLVTGALPRRGFTLYRVLFSILGSARFLVVPLAVANRGTLELPAWSQWGLSAVFLAASGYLFYSVFRYFGFERAAGLDHFDPGAPGWERVREGIFRYTSNGMYVFGFLVLWVPGLALESAAGLLAAAFQHAYIWVHYWCTEKPDMEHIYGAQSPSGVGR